MSDYLQSYPYVVILIISFVFLCINYIVDVVKQNNQIKRNKFFRDYAKSHNLMYVEEHSYIPNCPIKFVIATREGHSNYSNILMGNKNGFSFITLDYSVHTGGRRGSLHLTLCVVFKPKLNMPNFYARTEHAVADWMGEKLGGQDIDFIEDEDFSDKYVLEGFNESEIRKFFNSSIRKAFVDLIYKDYEYEGYGDYLLLSQNGFSDPSYREKMVSDGISILEKIQRTNTGGFTNDKLVTNTFGNTHQ